MAVPPTCDTVAVGAMKSLYPSVTAACLCDSIMRWFWRWTLCSCRAMMSILSLRIAAIDLHVSKGVLLPVCSRSSREGSSIGGIVDDDAWPEELPDAFLYMLSVAARDLKKFRDSSLFWRFAFGT
eukprot:6174206-Pleurochrysis_carterae.AAC.2